METAFDAFRQDLLDRLAVTSTDFHRYLFKKIDWNARLLCIKGAKGVGKTTMLLQHIKESGIAFDEILYVSLDDLWFNSNSLTEFVGYAYRHGIRHLYIDEVHYFKQWQTAIKNFYDKYPLLHIVYTGSSMLQLDANQGDLSRRLDDYTLSGLSFREYLEYEGIANIDSVSLDEITSNYIAIAMDVVGKTGSVLKHFSDYLRHGYYPFYKEAGASLSRRIQNVVRQVLDVDYPAIDDVQFETIQKAKKMLMVLAESVPQTPSMNELYQQLETSRPQGLKMLFALERAGLLAMLADRTKNLKNLSKPEKIFLNNPNLMYALGQKTDIGTVRETFFINQVGSCHNLKYPPKGDFLVDDRYLFEIGGKTKKFNQIKDIENSFLAIDDIEIGFGNKIPLWIFGMMY